MLHILNAKRILINAFPRTRTQKPRQILEKAFVTKVWIFTEVTFYKNPYFSHKIVAYKPLLTNHIFRTYSHPIMSWKKCLSCPCRQGKNLK